MYKYISLFLIISTHILMAAESIYTEAKIAIKMINKTDVQFISAQKSIKTIKNSKIVDVQSLSSSDILGRNKSCEPLYSCSKELEMYFSEKAITPNQSLLIYDNSHGIYAATLYTIFESIGHKNISIVNGGLEAILKIDPNQKIYTKYELELESLKKLVLNDNNSSVIKNYKSKIDSLKKKLEVLKPHLLINQKDFSPKSYDRIEYKINIINTDYLLSKNDLKKAVKELRTNSNESNITIIDVCPMVDIVGNEKGTYVAGVTALSWKELINKKEQQLKSNELLDTLFNQYNLKKHHINYLYCMSGSPKALFMMTAMRQVGYKKVKAFTGDWNVWVGDINE